MIKKILLAVSLVGASSAFAALPPFYQTQKELIKLLESSGLEKAAAPGNAITDIRLTDEGYKIVFAGDCFLFATKLVKPQPPGWTGPEIFSFEFSNLACPS